MRIHLVIHLLRMELYENNHTEPTLVRRDQATPNDTYPPTHPALWCGRRAPNRTTLAEHPEEIIKAAQIPKARKRAWGRSTMRLGENDKEMLQNALDEVYASEGHARAVKGKRRRARQTV
ncbi:hypothetical protein C8F01DRAFT_1076458 [Mycena amicta]|nr:hypothetical protein C8F01DRAFT_1076458 [Mycena amicta]